VGILYAEDPSFFGPLLREVIRLRPAAIVAAFVVGARGAGPRPKGMVGKLRRLATLWLLWETPGFVRELARHLLVGVAGLVGLTGTRFDWWSVRSVARKAKIPVIACDDPNSAGFVDQLKSLQLDALFNQTDRILKPPLLQAVRLGVVNRHGSLLPRFRGRMASFWSHAAEPPEEGLTFHLVDEGLDTGPILLQTSLEVDPRWPYPRVLRQHRESSPRLFWEAVDRLGTPGFEPSPNPHHGTTTHPFPSWRDVRRYREVLRTRRRQQAD
jgi:hypothetical protein